MTNAMNIDSNDNNNNNDNNDNYDNYDKKRYTIHNIADKSGPGYTDAHQLYDTVSNGAWHVCE